MGGSRSRAHGVGAKAPPRAELSGVSPWSLVGDQHPGRRARPGVGAKASPPPELRGSCRGKRERGRARHNRRDSGASA
jgi:hypothetical protein